MDFFKKHPKIKLVEDKDTAETAKRIHENQLKNIAAIGSIVAAKLYDLNIIAPEIQTANNKRFLNNCGKFYPFKSTCIYKTFY